MPTFAVPPIDRRYPAQGCSDDLGTSLHDVTFVVVDLETTGGSAASAAITEVGAVKVRGGAQLGEFQSLVNPGTPIPAFIAVLTGITDAAVATAPRLSAVLPAFLGFAGPAGAAVLVAHNAPFDVSFLRAGCSALGLDWPGYDVIDTARLARRVLTRDETPDCKLSSLARLFGTSTKPSHRALADARATVEVLHGLIARLGVRRDLAGGAQVVRGTGCPCPAAKAAPGRRPVARAGRLPVSRRAGQDALRRHLP